MVLKKEVRFPAEGGIELSAWMFVPERKAAAQLPAITMAHGYGGTKYHGIEPMAETFAEAGFVVLLHDHRGFGDSEGEPRHDINPWQQITDWRRAISYLQDRPEVDENRVGLWGTSFAGGHAIVLGVTDRRLRAVVAQVPTMDGYTTGLRRVAPEAVAALEAQFAADERAQLRGEPPATQAIVSDEASRAAISTHISTDSTPRRTPRPSGLRPTFDWRHPMRRIGFAIVAASALAGLVSYFGPATGQADQEAAPIYGIKIPERYRNWQLISANHLAGDNLKQVRAQLGNDIAIKAFREGKLPFPDGTIIAALHWNEALSEENNKVLASGFPGAGLQSFVAGSAVNVQFMVKDSKKYAATGGWGYADFTNGKPGTEALHQTCFACHQPAKDRDYVFTRYAP